MIQAALDESLSYDQKLVEFSKSENVNQRLICVRELVEGCFCSGFYISSKVLVPLVRKLSTDSDAQVRSECFEHLSELAGYLLQADYEEGYILVCDILVLAALTGLSVDVQSMNRQDAGVALVRLCLHMRSSDKFDRIVSPILVKLRLATDESQRMLLTELLGMLSCAVGESLCSLEIVPVMIACSHDPSPKVRRAVAVSIGEIFNTQTADLLDVFVLLCSDSDPSVRSACVQVLSVLLGRLPSDSPGADVLCTIFLTSFVSDESVSVRTVALSKTGLILAASPSQHVDALRRKYVEFASSSNHATSVELARAFRKILPWELLFPVFVHFVNFTNPDVRENIADSMKDLFRNKLLSWDLFTHVLALLGDENIHVASKMHENIGEILEFLTETEIETLFRWFSRSVKSSKWRRRLLTSRVLPGLIESLVVNSNFVFVEKILWKRLVPVWLSLVVDSTSLVQKTALDASRNLINALDPLSSPHLGPLCACIDSVLGTSSQCIDRQVFIQIAANFVASRNFPAEFFSYFFLPRLILLARDPVVVVRTTWAIEIPPLLRIAGGKLATNLPLVLAAHGLLTDPDAEIVRLVSKVTYAPMDEMSAPSTPAEILTRETKFETFKEWIAEINGPNSP